ncbi:MAG: HicB family protein [Microcystis panniformis Mp_MB_F_20051200_S6D]|nr:MAG: HicB family protein [Microcystis panniformis Mp_MB_F_20080800_S26D]TRV53857.1 MAG: HicB family protein [Microcystis panniformis Mp_GB_SS_20050300_S99D]TRV61800.1 MAG: HicB family protein [Microcystis panniformis Mp_MB_F_20051200_S9D]TRV69981.1 MAG: HicB family protein [Microcystis panniformis Mp_MB_F_20051200_S6D]
MTTYIATVHKEFDSDYGVQFYDFPGCISVGTTIEEAKTMATEALTGHLMLMLADGDQIPQPSNLETIVADADQKDAVAFLIIDIPNSIFNQTNKQAIAL